MIKNYSFALILFSFSSFSVHAMPSETMEPIIRHLDPESLSNLGNTNKGNAAIVKEYREGTNIPKTARFSCPTIDNVIQARQQAGRSAKQVTINSIEWQIAESSASRGNPLENLRNTHLKQLFIGRERDPNVEGFKPEGISCFYFIKEATSFYTRLYRPFTASSSSIRWESCHLDPDQPDVRPRERDSKGPLYIMATGSDRPLPDGATVVCEQQQK